MSVTEVETPEISSPEELQMDGLIARLTLAAYDVALQQGVRGRFTDLQSALWRELGVVVREAADQPRIRFSRHES